VLTVVVCVVSFLFAAVAELILRCKTTNGVVVKRFKDDAERVDVSRRFARRSALTHCLQLRFMGLTKMPSELFRMKNLMELDLSCNSLASLPSEIAHMTRLRQLSVRLTKRLDCDHDQKPRCFQVSHNKLTSLPPELGLLTKLQRLHVRQSRLIDLDLTHVTCFQVNNNQLTSLPTEIGQLRQLELFHVRNSN
jgi:Leucine-rich repeat (LRR) protein